MKPDNLWDSFKPRPCELLIPATCTKCFTESSLCYVLKAGPHLKALCRECRGYMKFVKESDLVPMRARGEDRNQLNKDVFVVCVAKDDGKGSIMSVVGSDFDLPEANKKRDQWSKKGYNATVSEMPVGICGADAPRRRRK